MSLSHEFRFKSINWGWSLLGISGQVVLQIRFFQSPKWSRSFTVQRKKSQFCRLFKRDYVSSSRGLRWGVTERLRGSASKTWMKMTILQNLSWYKLGYIDICKMILIRIQPVQSWLRNQVCWCNHPFEYFRCALGYWSHHVKRKNGSLSIGNWHKVKVRDTLLIATNSSYSWNPIILQQITYHHDAKMNSVRPSPHHPDWWRKKRKLFIGTNWSPKQCLHPTLSFMEHF